MSRHVAREPVRLALRAALAAHLAAHPDHAFATGVGGRLAYVRAPRDWPMPYAVLAVVAASDRDTVTERIDQVTLQVMVFAAEAEEAERLAAAAMDLFEGRVIGGDGLRDFEFWRGGDVPTLPDEDTTWQAGIQLCGLVETDM